MRAVTVAAAVMAILVSALAMSPGIDHRLLPAQAGVASPVNSGVVVVNGPAQSTPDASCHFGHSCTFLILPSNNLASMTRFDGAPEPLYTKQYQPSRAGDMPFHPPRLLSQV